MGLLLASVMKPDSFIRKSFHLLMRTRAGAIVQKPSNTVTRQTQFKYGSINQEETSSECHLPRGMNKAFCAISRCRLVPPLACGTHHSPSERTRIPVCLQSTLLYTLRFHRTWFLLSFTKHIFRKLYRTVAARQCIFLPDSKISGS